MDKMPAIRRTNAATRAHPARFIEHRKINPRGKMKPFAGGVAYPSFHA